MSKPHPAVPQPISPALVDGRLQLKGKIGFVISEDPKLTDILVEGPTLRIAMDGDRVRARVTSGPEAPRRAGELVSVLEHAHSTIVGTFTSQNGKNFITPEDSGAPILLTSLGVLTPALNDLAVAKITEWPTLESPAAGTLLEVLGRRDEPGVDLRVLIRKHDLPDAFPPEVQAEADAFGTAVPEALWRPRENLFDQRVFTIDGADAKDFDDAVSIQPLPDGGTRLGVHIADVSEYVRPGSALDREAFRRGTSVYLSGSVLPMLPFTISDGLCSLRPLEVRLTLSCEMDIDAQGHVTNHRIFESAIRSARRFTYEEVDRILNGETLPGLSEEIHEDVRKMGPLARQLRKNRFARGSLDFDFPEAEIKTDPHGRPIDIRQRTRLESHRLIEDFMLLANETVAVHMQKLPFLYRIHEPPEAHKLEKLQKSLEAVGIPVPRNFLSGKPEVLQKVLASSKDPAVQPMIQVLTLRSLKQAIYSDLPRGHYGLASECYTHFTSPIRRYPDLIVHRLLKEHLRNQLTAERQTIWKTQLPEIARHSSRRERAAVDAEREYMDLQKARLMESRVGEAFDGVISSVTAFGFFVQLSEVFVEGLVRVANLHDDYYVYDEVRMQLRGRRSNRVFHMGQKVRVQLAAANVVKRQLDFELLQDGKPGKPQQSNPNPNRSSHRGPGGGSSQGSRRGRHRGRSSSSHAAPAKTASASPTPASNAPKRSGSPSRRRRRRSR